MIRFCPHCGKELEPGVRFCPSCGKAVPEIQSQGAESTRPSAPAGGNPASANRNRILAGGLVVLLLLGGGAFYFQHQKSQEASQAATMEAQEAKTEKTEKTAEPQGTKDPVGTVQKILDQEGLSGKVMATSYGHDPNGSLSLIGGKGRRLLVIDEKITRRLLWMPRPGCTSSSIIVPGTCLLSPFRCGSSASSQAMMKKPGIGMEPAM